MGTLWVGNEAPFLIRTWGQNNDSCFLLALTLNTVSKSADQQLSRSPFQ